MVEKEVLIIEED